MTKNNIIDSSKMVCGGRYEAVVRKFRIGKSLTEKPYLDIEFTVTDPPYQGGSVHKSIPLDGGRSLVFDRFLDAFGIGPGDTIETDLFVGRKVHISVSNQPDPNGAMRPTVINIRSVSAQAVSGGLQAKK